MMPRRKTTAARVAKALHNVRNRRYYRAATARIRTYQNAYYSAGRGKAGLLYRDARKRSRENGVAFSITLADVVVPEVCPLLGVVLKVGRGLQIDSSPTLDRIENDKGYIPGNVWVICLRANRLKNNATPDELMRIAIGVRNRLAEARQ